MNKLPNNENLSPCIRNCCLNEQDVCLGCYRHLDEITGWQAFTKQEKIAILSLCTKRKVASNYLQSCKSLD
ncbi:DUF1289 domain-containing protein [Thalassotalea sp. G2M2-11]|uniref:DUF1289 domain-containing protein n=1 Tax=Thalassotalea sp. G2M2-11 TaxID=2787627 RepID=UPI0019D0394C|nr:DUF1289 domain-containing protein [Thalassotalea sp. G2M2-11]